MSAVTLPKVVTKRKKRLGRGFGSGRGGHTVGRGVKGQKSRGKLGVLFEGVKVKKSLLKRLPLRRGKGKFKSKNKPIIIKLSYLNLFPPGTRVDIDTLVSKGIVNKEDAQKWGIKILGDGDIKKSLAIAVPISKGAAKKIEKAKGKIVKEQVKTQISLRAKPGTDVKSKTKGKDKIKREKTRKNK